MRMSAGHYDILQMRYDQNKKPIKCKLESNLNLMLRSHLQVKPSRKSHVRWFSRHGVGRGYLVGITGFTWNVWLLRGLHGCYGIYSLKRIEWIFTLFVTDVTPWEVTSVITSFGVNIEWTGQDSTRWVVNFHSTGVRIEWNSLLNEWNFLTP